MKFSEGFFRAVGDYRYLLERNYPQKAMLKLVGDRYQLPAFERVMLYRGLAKEEEVACRQKKQTDQFQAGTIVTLDGFNVCRTVGSYLNGNPVFVGMDGFLRDVSELHRKKLKWEVLERSTGLILDFLKAKKAGYVRFYFDTPISHSGKMCEMTKTNMVEKGLSGEAQTVFSPDHALISAGEGIICTADSNIIENAKVPVYDLARHLLQERFHAEVFSFAEYLIRTKMS
jgi:hypothetical protein